MSSETAVDSDLLKHFVPLNSLRAENLRDLAKKSEVKTASPGTALFSVGDAAKTALWIIEGKVQQLVERGEAGFLEALRECTGAATFEKKIGAMHKSIEDAQKYKKQLDNVLAQI